jgi:Tol biopolymer transport system component
MKKLFHLFIAVSLHFLFGCQSENDPGPGTTNNNLLPAFANTPLPNALSNGELVNLAISGDGRFIVVTTSARLVANDQDNFTDVYRFDRQNNTWLLLSPNLVSHAFSASISNNGNRVLFTASQSPALPSSPTAIYLWENNTVRPIQQGVQDPSSPIPLITPLVAFSNIISPNGQQIAVSIDLKHIVAPLQTLQGAVVSNGQPSDFSTDGRFHTWVNVDILTVGQSPVVWLYDAATGNNIPITRTTKYSDSPKISGDGRLVVFESEHGDLTGAEDNNGLMDIFLFDQTVPKYTRLTSPEANGISRTPDISADGNVIVFSSSANNLGVADNNFTFDIYAYINGQLVNLTLGSNQANVSPVLSNDGRFVAYVSGPADVTGTVSPQNAQVFIAGPLR